MITYGPLRDYLTSIGRSINYLRSNNIINSNAAKDIAEDNPISFRRIIKICQFLDVPIERVVKVIPKAESQESNSTDL